MREVSLADTVVGMDTTKTTDNSGEEFPGRLLWPNFGGPSESGRVWAKLITVPDENTMLAGAWRLGVATHLAKAAISNLRRATVSAVVFSGKLASGKDTVASEVSKVLKERGLAEAVIHRTSDPMREELSRIIELIHLGGDHEAGVRLLVAEMGFREREARYFTSYLFESTRGEKVSAETRTDANRHLLQYLADEGRRAYDPDYWVKKTFPLVLTDLAEGRSSFVSGGRYPNEIGPAQALGMVTVRLIVSRKVQEDRLRGRDGLAPNPKLLDDPNECALDDYAGFNLVVGNDNTITPTVEVVVNEVAAHASRLYSA